jgi:octaprenyl-diphosphate synthase
MDFSMTLKELYAPIQDGLEQVEAILARELSSQSKLVDEFMAHVASFRGKRLRPALALLAGKCLGEVNGAHVNFAAFVELIHTATLIHDDILDEAQVRRGIPTISAKWGTEISVLLGDFVFSRAFSVFAAFDGMACLPYVARTTSAMCEGELTQLVFRHDLDVPEESYIRIAEHKTASLCALSTQLGAKLSGATEAQLNDFHRFGLKFGLAFQITDDCLDIAGKESVVGKALGTDLKQGKLTLPAIRLIRMLSPEERAEVGEIVKNGLPEQSRPRFRELAVKYRAVESSMETARQFVDEARKNISDVPDSPAKRSLLGLSEYVLSRER